MNKPGKRSSKEEDLLRKLLLKEAVFPRDALPYTDEFDRLRKIFEKETGRPVSASDFWRALARIGKRGGLSRRRPRRKAPPAPRTSTEQQLEILRLFPDGIGNRDRLPYTRAFDDAHRRFSRLTKTTFTKYEFWRILSRVAKRSRKPQPLFETAPLGGLHTDLVSFLEFQNPWWKGRSAKRPERFRRWAFAEVIHRLDSGLAPIVAIRGPRQVGKTTIQEQLIEELLLLQGVNPSHILRVEFENVPSLGSFRQPILAIVKWFEENVLCDSINAVANRGESVYLFFDELQNLKTWASQLKALVDHRAAKTFVTGSSALRIAHGQDSLAGRVSMIELGPLRLREIAGVRQIGTLPPFHPKAELDDWTTPDFWLELIQYAATHEAALKAAFQAFSELGGYPVCHKSPRADRSELAPRVVDIVVERTLRRDLTAGPGGKMRDPRLLEETFRRVCRYAGQAVSPGHIKEEVEQILSSGIGTKKVRDAIQFLADAMLVHEVQPLELLLKKQRRPAKFCLCDHFVREAWLQERIPIDPAGLTRATQAVSTSAGHIIESVIGYFLKGIPGLDVAWFPPRSGEPEVDFVLTIGMRRIPIEIKYRRGKPTPDDLQGLERFCAQEKYNAPFGLVITQQTGGRTGDHVIAVPARTLLCVK